MRQHRLRFAGMAAAVAAAALCLASFAGASAAAARTHAADAAHAAASGGTWGKAEEVPGTAALNKGGDAEINSVSCASAGSCSAGGTYASSYNSHTGLYTFQAFVAGEADGTWGTAEEVPGTAALNKGGDAEIKSVSCASAGNCSGGGSYASGTDASPVLQAFVVNEVRGTWGKAVEVPGTAALNYSGAILESVSCASAGNCSAVGFYTTRSGQSEVFTVGEANGTWGTAKELPGIAVLNQGGNALPFSVSCGSAGNCSAGGFYFDSSGNQQAFIASEVNGAWEKAEEVPGTAASNTGGQASTYSVSCASAGNCSAGGTYTDSSGDGRPFVVGEANGTWRKAEQVPGTAALAKGVENDTFSVSCASAGNCGAGGDYTAGSAGQTHAFVAGEKSGTWGKAEQVPGTAALNTGGQASIVSVSCASAGNCSAGGYYVDGSGHQQVFVVGEKSGIWEKAEEVPGTAALNTLGEADMSSVSCASAGHCSAGGDYTNRSGQQVFVVSET